MKQKIIICGAGRVGISITEHLSNEGFDITVIDSNVDAIQKASKATIPLARYGTVSEFSAVATFLASEAASYVTGSQIRCDGGLIRAV